MARPTQISSASRAPSRRPRSASNRPVKSSPEAIAGSAATMAVAHLSAVSFSLARASASARSTGDSAVGPPGSSGGDALVIAFRISPFATFAPAPERRAHGIRRRFDEWNDLGVVHPRRTEHTDRSHHSTLIGVRGGDDAEVTAHQVSCFAPHEDLHVLGLD